MVSGDLVEASLDVPARDGVQRAGQPIPEIVLGFIVVKLICAFRAFRIGAHVVLEGVFERRHGAGLGTFLCGVAAAGNLAEDVLGKAPCLVGGNLAVPRDHDSLVGGLSATVARAVVDDEGLGA